VPVESTEEALNGATSSSPRTTTSTPFVKESWLSEGITFYSIGKNQEMESRVLQERRQVRRRQLAPLQKQIGHAAHAQRKLS
jgi:ornithine cyclodeaminase/alanine dehydrogenase-like protein (mu-crystallin family)